MIISAAAVNVLNQIAQMIRVIEVVDYSRPCKTLGGSTIGQHVRHTLEFLMCFEKGYGSGVVNYDRRSHDRIIETDKALAERVIARVIEFVRVVEGGIPLRLEVQCGPDGEYESVDTNGARELVYNIEHAVHHMAIMRIALREVAPYVVVEDDFGVAPSTLRYRQGVMK